MNLEQLLNLVNNALDNMKAQDIVAIDVRDKSSITEYMVIATGTSTRHVKSIAGEVIRDAKAAGVPPLGSEGEDNAEWVLVDLNDIVVHVMLAEIRSFYNLEKLWDTDHIKSNQQQADDDAAEATLVTETLSQQRQAS
ncbi:MAG: ribosome silencing factor [bacterium]